MLGGRVFMTNPLPRRLIFPSAAYGQSSLLGIDQLALGEAGEAHVSKQMSDLVVYILLD